MELTEKMEQAGFDALDEYAGMKATGVFPRPSLIAHLWSRMMEAAPKGSRPCIHGKRDDEGCEACDEMTAEFEDHDCGEDTCACRD